MYDLSSGTNTYITRLKNINVKKCDVINGNAMSTYDQAYESH